MTYVLCLLHNTFRHSPHHHKLFKKSKFFKLLCLQYPAPKEVAEHSFRGIKLDSFLNFSSETCKGLPQQAKVAQGVPGSLRPRIFLMFGTTRVEGRQPYAPAAFTPGEIPGIHFFRG